MSEPPAHKRDPYAAWRAREFRFYGLTRLLVAFGIQMQSVAVGWQIYQLTHDPGKLGLIGLAEAIPALSVALWAGHVADVMNRRTILLVSASGLVLATAALAVASLPAFEGFLGTHVWTIYAIIFATGLFRGFINPAGFGLLGQVVPAKDYGNASAWNGNLWQTACIAGPALGGLLYGVCGAAFTYGTAALLIFAGVVCLFGVRSRPAQPQNVKQSVVASIHEGLRFVFNHQVVLAAMSLDLFAVLFGGAVALLPIYADQILHVGSIGVGLLRAAPAAGSLAMGIFLSFHPVGGRAGAAMFWNVAGFGVCMILFAVSRNFLLSFGWLALSGMFDAVSVFVRWTTFQMVTPDHMKGRVAAVSSIFIGSSNEIGEFESGVAAKMMGTVPSVIFGGGMTLLVVAVTAWLAPKLRRLDLSKLRT